MTQETDRKAGPPPRPAPPLTPLPPPHPGLAPAGAGAREIGGPEGPEPTRYGDWERKGRVSDF